MVRACQPWPCNELAVWCTCAAGVQVVEGVLEFRAAVDLLMLERSTFFVGNAYSSFSWTVRLVRLRQHRRRRFACDC